MGFALGALLLALVSLGFGSTVGFVGTGLRGHRGHRGHCELSF